MAERVQMNAAKNLITKTAAIISAAALSIGSMSAVPVFCDTQSSSVTATVASSYTVSIPSSITMTETAEASKYSASYNVGAKGDILKAEKITIVPASSFMMTNSEDASTATATVSQAQTEWVTPPSVTDAATQVAIQTNSTATTAGTITATLSKSGTYTGSLVFTVTKS